MKTWAVSQIRYGAVTVKWAKNNLGKVDYVIGDYVKNLEGAIQKYDHELDGIIERKVCKIKKEVKIVNINIPGDVRVNKRKVRKVEKYKMLKDEIIKM